MRGTEEETIILSKFEVMEQQELIFDEKNDSEEKN